jgi:predicted nucleic acid-binding protein
LIISNTTPLINFSSIERLDILHKLFGEIMIPPAVNTELLEKVKVFPKLQLALDNPCLKRGVVDLGRILDAMKSPLSQRGILK